jgi:integrase
MQTDISRDEWEQPKPKSRPLTFSEHADRWLTQRTLKPRTRAHYRSLIDQKLDPTFGDMALKSITTDDVDAWYTRLGSATPTARSHAYGLLRTVMGDAVQRRLIDFNPVHIRGAGNVKRVKKIRPASLDELSTIVESMPEKQRLMILLASWCALRFGELTELRRSDLDLKDNVIRVRRGVVRADGEKIVDTPKSDAGIRDVAIPPHLVPVIKEHLRMNISGGRDGLLFPGADGVSHLAPSSFYGRVTATTTRKLKDGTAKTTTKRGWGFYQARHEAGRDDLRFHDLRHTGAVLAAQTGATLAELMGRLGHSTPQAALRYQHAAADRDQQIAAALSKMVERDR